MHDEKDIFEVDNVNHFTLTMLETCEKNCYNETISTICFECGVSTSPF